MLLKPPSFKDQQLQHQSQQSRSRSKQHKRKNNKKEVTLKMGGFKKEQISIPKENDNQSIHSYVSGRSKQKKKKESSLGGIRIQSNYNQKSQDNRSNHSNDSKKSSKNNKKQNTIAIQLKIQKNQPKYGYGMSFKEAIQNQQSQISEIKPYQIRQKQYSPKVIPYNYVIQKKQEKYNYIQPKLYKPFSQIQDHFSDLAPIVKLQEPAYIKKDQIIQKKNQKIDPYVNIIQIQQSQTIQTSRLNGSKSKRRNIFQKNIQQNNSSVLNSIGQSVISGVGQSRRKSKSRLRQIFNSSKQKKQIQASRITSEIGNLQQSSRIKDMSSKPIVGQNNTFKLQQKILDDQNDQFGMDSIKSDLRLSQSKNYNVEKKEKDSLIFQFQPEKRKGMTVMSKNINNNNDMINLKNNNLTSKRVEQVSKNMITINNNLESKEICQMQRIFKQNRQFLQKSSIFIQQKRQIQQKQNIQLENINKQKLIIKQFQRNQKIIKNNIIQQNKQKIQDNMIQYNKNSQNQRKIQYENIRQKQIIIKKDMNKIKENQIKIQKKQKQQSKQININKIKKTQIIKVQQSKQYQIIQKKQQQFVVKKPYINFENNQRNKKIQKKNQKRQQTQQSIIQRLNTLQSKQNNQQLGKNNSDNQSQCSRKSSKSKKKKQSSINISKKPIINYIRNASPRAQQSFYQQSQNIQSNKQSSFHIQETNKPKLISFSDNQEQPIKSKTDTNFYIYNQSQKSKPPSSRPPLSKKSNSSKSFSKQKKSKQTTLGIVLTQNNKHGQNKFTKKQKGKNLFQKALQIHRQASLQSNSQDSFRSQQNYSQNSRSSKNSKKSLKKQSSLKIENKKMQFSKPPLYKGTTNNFYKQQQQQFKTYTNYSRQRQRNNKFLPVQKQRVIVSKDCFFIDEKGRLVQKDLIIKGNKWFGGMQNNFNTDEYVIQRMKRSRQQRNSRSRSRQRNKLSRQNSQSQINSQYQNNSSYSGSIYGTQNSFENNYQNHTNNTLKDFIRPNKQVPPLHLKNNQKKSKVQKKQEKTTFKQMFVRKNEALMQNSNLRSSRSKQTIGRTQLSSRKR